MGPAISRYALLFFGQFLATVTVLVQQHAGSSAPSPAAPPSTDQIAVYLTLAASWLATTAGGWLLHKLRPPKSADALEPSPTEPLDGNRELAQAAGEAFEAASKATSAKKPPAAP